jgi:type VI secretion system protein ImpA
MREDDGLRRDDREDVWAREAKVADWRAVIETATEALAKKTKDLQIAAWLTRALVKRHGFAGLRDGFHLLRELQERFWDSLYPEMEDGDVEVRTGPLEGLNATLPLSIQQIVLTQSGDSKPYNWLHWDGSRLVDNLARQNQEEALQDALQDGKITGEQFTKAVTATPRAFYETLFEDVQQCRDECERLDRVGDEKYGREAPSLVEVKKALDECHGLIGRIRKEKREREGIKDESEAPSSTSPENQAKRALRVEQEEVVTFPTVAGSVPFEPQNRIDALRRLEAIAAFFRRTEPHSPIAYLVQRAARWGQMPLEEWLREVVKSEDVLSHIRETLGIKEPETHSTDGSE